MVNLKESQAKETKSTEILIQKIQDAISYRIGEDFFQSVILNLASTIKADYTFVGEFRFDTYSVGTIALSMDGQIVPNFEYSLSGTPCSNIMQERTCIYPANVQSLFPDDHLLEEMGVEAYIGVPLFGSNHVVLGLMVALFKRSLNKQDEILNQMIMEIFSGRAGAELERIHVERKLKSNESKLQSIINNTSAVVFTKDLEGRYTLVNKEWKKLFNLTDEKILGKNDLELFPQNIAEGFMKNDQEVMKNNITIQTEEFAPVNGELRTYLSSKFPLIDVHGKVTGMGGVATDITDQKKIQKQLEKITENLEEKVKERTEELASSLQKIQNTQSKLIEAEKMASLGVLTAGIAHEINNPINFIHSSIQGLKGLFDDILSLTEMYKDINQENVQSKLQEIESFKKEMQFSDIKTDSEVLFKNIMVGAQRVAEITKGLRTFSHPNQDTFVSSHISELMETSLVLSKNELKDRIQVEKIFSEIPPVECLPGKLIQVFINIIQNAIQATPGKGKIVIKLMYIPAASSPLNLDSVQIAISDDGIGISAESKDKIFEPFFTTKEVGKGIGLGLSISFNIVKQHNGKIGVNSKKDKGSEFEIFLPIRQS